MYFKRKDNAKWMRSGKLLEQDGQQILVKHSSVCPCSSISFNAGI